MLTKRHIKRHLNKISASYEDQKHNPGLVWKAFHDYAVKHYQRLDKGARIFVDEIFDGLDSRVKAWIDALPEGAGKKKLQRKFAMVKGERSPVPIVFMDTPVLEAVIRQRLGHEVPPDHPLETFPFHRIQECLREARVICPENSFHREVLQAGGAQGQNGMDVLRTQSEGLSFSHGQTIEDFQVFRALQAFIGGNENLVYRKHWKDAFPQKTLQAIFNKRSTVAFQEGAFLVEKSDIGDTDHLGHHQEHHQEHDQGQDPGNVRLRIRYDIETYREERQLKKRSARHLRDLTRLGLRFRTMAARGDPFQDRFWSEQKTDLPVTLWNLFGGTPQGIEGLAAFFSSDLFQHIPAIKVKEDVWHAFFKGGKTRLKRATGPADVALVATVLPYADIMILGKQMARIVRDRLGLGEEYDTAIYSLEEGALLRNALNVVPGAD